MKPTCLPAYTRRLILTGIVFAFFTACTPFSSKPDEFNPAFSTYLSAFTGGWISSHSTILVELTEEIPEAIPGDEVQNPYLKFSPSIPGKLIWKNARTLEFIPENPLPQGQKYQAVLKLGELYPVDQELSEFRFSFQVLKQFARGEITDILSKDDQDFTWLSYKGRVITNDAASAEAVEKMVRANQVGKKLNISWEHSRNGMVHTFIMDSVERKQKESQLTIEFDSREIGSDVKMPDIQQDIPALGVFKVLKISPGNSKEQSILIQLSDPIDPSQDLRGLVDLPGIQGLSIQTNKNQVIIYPPERISGLQQVFIHRSLRNSSGISLLQDIQTEILLEDLKPAVKLISNGVIIPGNKGYKIPFKAVNLRAVQVKIIKIFESNVMQFLQNNSLDGEYELKRVGRLIYKRDIPLVSDKDINLKDWNAFALELDDLIEAEPGAIYRIYINFRMEHSLYDCNQDIQNQAIVFSKDYSGEEEFYDRPSRYYYHDDSNYDYSVYDYNEIENPCHPTYYMGTQHSVSQNILASNFGLTVKEHSNNELRVIANDLLTAQPIADLDVELYNYQQQLLDHAKTDRFGFASFKAKGKGFLVVAKRGEEKGYLRIDDGSARSLSMFEVGGQEVKLGVKGAIYTERGVWRPGDSIFVSFVLEDKLAALPANQPVIFELYNSNNQLIQKKVIADQVNGFYSFKTATAADAPTGNWSLYVKAGGSVYSKTLKIETVKPNRLKILYSFLSDHLSVGQNNSINLEVKWLTGASSGDLRAAVDLQLYAGLTRFDDFEGYVFDDQSRTFTSDERRIFDGDLDSDGKVVINPDIQFEQEAPGMLMAFFKIRAFEKGGDFSTQQASIQYSPFSSYVGLKIPTGDGWNGSLESDKPIIIPIASVDPKGNPINRNTIRVEVYEIAWSWWWEESEDRMLSEFISAEGQTLIKTDYINTVNGRANYELNFEHPSWGKKFIRIIDPVSGHISGTSFFTTYSGWWDSGSTNPGGAEMLSFNTDKEEYLVGEEVKISLPGLMSGKALISLEKGNQILDMFWVDSKTEDHVVSFKTNAKMSPNVYVQISMLQSADHPENDHPIRMYGVKNISVIDPASKLEPLISMKDELRPLEKFQIAVSEKNKKAMTYTLAVVDEGLLDLTSFSTPDLWSSFYQKEALAVKTWDLYPYVMNPFNGELAGLLAIGGGEGELDKQSAKQNRFIPVVKYLGPFQLKAGSRAVHEIDMPNYIGSVRVMLVAGGNGAYGSAEKTVPVKKSLMVLGTLPRVIGPKEQFTLPVTLFMLDPQFSQVDIELQVQSPFKINGPATKSVQVKGSGEIMVDFEVETLEKIGQGQIKIIAKGGTEKASYETNLEVRIPNPKISTATTSVISPGKSWVSDYEVIGLAGTNEVQLEVSSIQSLNLKGRLEYLIQYPHGCIEQTTSSVFPQLFLGDVSDLSESSKKDLEKNIKAGISRIKNFQTYSGGLSYWPGESDDSQWGTNYALHFLLEAKSKGYSVQEEMLSRVISYQIQKSNEWRSYQPGAASYESNDLVQSYRLYTLALAGKPNLGAMNRLINESSLSDIARYRLAAAYFYAGRKDIAEKLFNVIPNQGKREYYDPYSYGDYTRDQALLLETSLLLKNHELSKYCLMN
jgi:alpha-2-macroglobulin